jgi:glucose-1-phosphate adenylyltransferase
MGADFYETTDAISGHQANGDPPLGVGEGCHIEGAIIDKNVRIGRNVRIINERGLENTEETPYGMIRDGIVVTAKGTALPDGWRL